MFAKDFKEFQKLYLSNRIQMVNNKFNRNVYEFSYYFLQKGKYNIQEINRMENKSKIMMIDHYKDFKNNYLLFCFDKNILIISIIDLNLIKPFLSSNKDTTFYPLSSNAKTFFMDYLHHYLNYCFKFSKFNKDEIEDINVLIKNMQISNQKLSNFWKIIRKCIASYLLNISYKKATKNRIQYFKIKNISFAQNDFITLRNIGVMNSSTIYLIYHIEKEKLFTLKVFHDNDERNDLLYNQEKENYENIRHPFLSRYYGTKLINQQKCLILEYIKGHSLLSINQLHLKFNEKIKIIFQILIVVEYIHQNKFNHRSLIPDNIMIDQNKTVVIIDRERMAKENSNQKPVKALYHYYLAPEIQSSTNFSYEADVYSIGLLIYFILMEKQPHFHHDEVFNPIVTKFDEYPKEYSELINVCKSCIEIKKFKRPKISDLIDFIYFNYFSKYSIINESKLIQSVGDIHSIKYHLFWIYLSDNHSSYCQYQIGQCFKDGSLFKKNIQRSIQYHNFAAKQNLVHSLYMLGYYYYNGSFIQQDIKKAIHYFLLAFNLNSANACFSLGCIYFDPYSGVTDIHKSIYYFDIAATKYNMLRAQINLYVIYKDGNLIKQDIKKSIYYLTLAACSNNPKFQLTLGISYCFLYKDYELAIKYISLAADQNYPNALYALGTLYYDGIIIKKDIPKAIKYLTICSKYGNELAQYYLGNIFNVGVYVPKDIDKSIYYYTLAANKGNANACFFLGEIYMYSLKKPDIEKALHYLTIAANKKQPLALTLLGIFYEKSDENNIELAIHYYQLAVEISNNKLASFLLAIIYLKGEYVHRNVNKAIYYFEIAAKNNDPVSLFILARLYYNEELIRRNINLSIKYYTQSADLNNQEASFDLATIYIEGKYVKRDVSKAIYYYKNASSFNYYFAKNNLGVIYKNGFKTPKNITYAIELFNEAINQKNDAVAMYNLAHLYLYNNGFENKINESIQLLIKSSSSGFPPSSTLLCIWLVKKHKSITLKKIINELKRFDCSSDKLADELFGTIQDFYLFIPEHYLFHYETFKNKDFLYDVSRNYVSSYFMWYENDEIYKKYHTQKDLTADFYQGFGSDI